MFEFLNFKLFSGPLGCAALSWGTFETSCDFTAKILFKFLRVYSLLFPLGGINPILEVYNVTPLFRLFPGHFPTEATCPVHYQANLRPLFFRARFSFSNLLSSINHAFHPPHDAFIAPPCGRITHTPSSRLPITLSFTPSDYPRSFISPQPGRQSPSDGGLRRREEGGTGSGSLAGQPKGYPRAAEILHVGSWLIF